MGEISKIKLPNGQEYNLKDLEFRRMINVLLGVEEQVDCQEQSIKTNENDNQNALKIEK